MNLAKRTLELIDEIVEEYLEEIGEDEDANDIPEEVEWTEDELKELETKDEAAPKKKIVIRAGKRVVKMVCAKNFKYDPKKKQCVKMKSSEIVSRRKASLKAAKKRAAKSAQIAKKRAKSLKLKK